MNDDTKFSKMVLICIFSCLLIMVGGCNMSTYFSYKHEEIMAKLGYEEVVESLPGISHSVRCWRR